jgi:hypothetical protein
VGRVRAIAKTLSMDNSDELKKKADEFMEILRKKREEAEKLEKARRRKSTLDSLRPRYFEKPKEDYSYLMQELFKKPLEIPKSTIETKEKPKKSSDWGCLIIIIGVGLAIVFIFNAVMENFDDSSPWFIAGMTFYILLILLAAMQGSKRRY